MVKPISKRVKVKKVLGYHSNIIKPKAVWIALLRNNAQEVQEAVLFSAVFTKEPLIVIMHEFILIQNIIAKDNKLSSLSTEQTAINLMSERSMPFGVVKVWLTFK